MTPINSYFEAAEPRTLEGIPEDFFTWAAETHEWTRSELLKLGRTRSTNLTDKTALDVFLGNFLLNQKGACDWCGGLMGVEHNVLGSTQCIDCSGREYRARIRRLHFAEAEWIAAGSPDSYAMEVTKAGYCPWAELSTRVDLARKRFAKWAKSSRNQSTAQESLLGTESAYPD